MSVSDFISLLGGVALFLFGMSIMGDALKKVAGNQLELVLYNLTSTPIKGVLLGTGVTAVIQSSSATTVMVVGFVNSGLMTLRQAINVIMGANVGTTVTAWLLSLGGISGDSIWVRLLKPTSFTPVLALVGIIFFMFCKDNKKKDTGTVLLGFATLMFGMETMSSAVGGLADVPAFRQLFITFQNPVLGLLAGAVLTAIIQSSSASVGILQALAVTGQVSYGAAIPIIMGQNIGTCVTALLSSVGANKNAKRAAFVHLSFNVIGSVVLLTAYSIVRAIFAPAILGEAATLPGIAVIHTAFNLLCVAILMPMAPLLEKLALRVIHDAPAPEHETELDERLLASPALALGQCREVTMKMVDCAVQALRSSLLAVTDYTPALAEQVRADEEATDHYEDILGTYLVKLSSQTLTAADSENATELLKVIGDFERIADHAVNIVESAEELQSKGLTLSEAAQADLKVLDAAVEELFRFCSAERIGEMTAQYRSVVEPFVWQQPDILHEPLSRTEYDTVARGLHREITENRDAYRESLHKPMPFYIGVPEPAGEQLKLLWDASFDLNAEDIVYTAELAKDYQFTTTFWSEADIRLPETVVYALPAGHYFLRVRATNTSGYTQDAFDYYVMETGKAYGMKSFFVEADGSVTEDLYEE